MNEVMTDDLTALRDQAVQLAEVVRDYLLGVQPETREEYRWLSRLIETAERLGFQI